RRRRSATTGAAGLHPTGADCAAAGAATGRGAASPRTTRFGTARPRTTGPGTTRPRTTRAGAPRPCPDTSRSASPGGGGSDCKRGRGHTVPAIPDLESCFDVDHVPVRTETPSHHGVVEEWLQVETRGGGRGVADIRRHGPRDGTGRGPGPQVEGLS